jgi:hypothetical protein
MEGALQRSAGTGRRLGYFERRARTGSGAQRGCSQRVQSKIVVFEKAVRLNNSRKAARGHKGTQKPENLETRNPKFETISNDQKRAMIQTGSSDCRFGFSRVLCLSDRRLFRISCFGFRILIRYRRSDGVYPAQSKPFDPAQDMLRAIPRSRVMAMRLYWLRAPGEG